MSHPGSPRPGGSIGRRAEPHDSGAGGAAQARSQGPAGPVGRVDRTARPISPAGNTGIMSRPGDAIRETNADGAAGPGPGFPEIRVVEALAGAGKTYALAAIPPSPDRRRGGARRHSRHHLHQQGHDARDEGADPRPPEETRPRRLRPAGGAGRAQRETPWLRGPSPPAPPPSSTGSCGTTIHSRSRPSTASSTVSSGCAYELNLSPASRSRATGATTRLERRPLRRAGGAGAGDPRNDRGLVTHYPSSTASAAPRRRRYSGPS